jgi:hypothetical protein
MNGLRVFLKAVFHAADDAPLIDPAQMRWKLYEPRPDWPAPRSYVLTQDGSIVAHSTILPVTFLAPSGTISSLNPLDWAASQIGGGVQLLRRLQQLSETFLGLDAAPVTYELLKKLRYRLTGDLEMYTRVVRPLRTVRPRVHRGAARAAFGLVRNTLRLLKPVHRVPREWSATPIARFEDTIREVLPRASDAAPFTPVQRSAAVLNYMLRCPAAEFSGFLIHQQGRPRGYFLLSRVKSEARIADIHVDSWDPQDWQIAFSLATSAAAGDPRISVVVASAAAPFIRRAIVANGYWRASQDPIFLFDPKQRFAGLPPPNVSLIDGDMAYL